MPCRTLVPAVVLAALSVFGTSASSGRMPVDEIRPGMVGVGRTVFEGDRIEEFKVHFVGVLGNVLGPSRNLILAKLEGGPLASTGVMAGMSGSPVYVDDASSAPCPTRSARSRKSRSRALRPSTR